MYKIEMLGGESIDVTKDEKSIQTISNLLTSPDNVGRFLRKVKTDDGRVLWVNLNNMLYIWKSGKVHDV